MTACYKYFYKYSMSFCDPSQNVTLDKFLLTLSNDPNECRLDIKSSPEISHLPCLLNVANLVDIVLHSTNLVHLPNMPLGLRSLDCTHNQILSLPPNLESLTACTFLNCSRNPLEVVPALPPNLVRWFCEYTRLKTLPPLPKSLRSLEIGHCEISGPLLLSENIQYVSCEDNFITNISSTGSMPQLESLYCQFNALESFGNLPNMRFLDCAFNRLRTLRGLPREVVALTCSSNQFTHFPDIVTTGLLECVNNPLVSLPDSAMYGLRTLFAIENTTLHNAFAIAHPVNTNDLTSFWMWNEKLNKTRFRIMCLKFRKPLRQWLWDRVRRPKIEHRFHWRNLHVLLDSIGEDGDDDAAIQEWINE